MEGVNEVLPNIETHPEFGVAIDDAKKAGVNIVFIKCRVYENRLEYIV